MLAFLIRLLCLVLLARLFLGLVRLVRGRRRPAVERPSRPDQPAIPSHLGADIVDAEFEEVRRKGEG